MNSSPGSESVLLIGASTRAAAHSARRAGWTPWCADLFADADLRPIATVRKVPLNDYPRGLLSALEVAPPGSVLYCGGLENRPDLIARIARPLWGNPPAVLRAVRSPTHWTHCLQCRGLSCPLLADLPTTGRWLLKPKRSAGGLGIRVYTGQAFDPRTYFLQEQIDGLPCSAVFLGHDGGAMLLGVTQQLIGVPWLHATGFHYAGNVGPLPLADPAHWQAVGSSLVKEFHLRGLFGVDAILRDGVPWPIEINPRYTASVEILERSLGMALLPWHRNAFDPGGRVGRSSCKDSAGASPSRPITGKAIWYASTLLTFPPDGPWLSALQADANLDDVEYADIPHPGDQIAPGQPVLTFFASATTVAECLAKLQDKAGTLDRCLS